MRNEQKGKENQAVSTAKLIFKTIEGIEADEISKFESELRKLISQFEELKDIPGNRKDIQAQFSKSKKVARKRLENLKKNNASKSFKNLLTFTELLGKLEDGILNKEFETESASVAIDKLCTDSACEDHVKNKMKVSLINLCDISDTKIEDHLQEQKDKLKELCVGLEIELELDSPTQDKPLRMELQVKRLNKKFNQSDNDKSIAEKIISAFYIGGLYSFQDATYINRLINLQEKNTQ